MQLEQRSWSFLGFSWLLVCVPQCQCAYGQPQLEFCTGGYYRWAINVFTFTRNVSAQFGPKTPSFDEPAVSIGWPMRIAPHRVGMVGESLFVHCQVSAS